uniref:Uncharacterized protein n=1 Tax=Arundo donax TaxID=35708 RepID=A0A0A8Y1U5_ARUDO
MLLNSQLVKVVLLYFYNIVHLYQ